MSSSTFKRTSINSPCSRVPYETEHTWTKESMSVQPCLISLWQTNMIFAHPGALGDRVTDAGNKVTRAKKSHGNLNLRLVTHRHCNSEFRGGLEHFQN